MHGGASPRGEAHPRYKHDHHSKYKPLDTEELIRRYANVDISAIFAEILSQANPLADLLKEIGDPLAGLDLEYPKRGRAGLVVWLSTDGKVASLQPRASFWVR